ncbi:MAG: leucine-rich repeat domain-containing protein, partial [Clostridia bacterium]|nr:leucine-rich repeat domain-containing protein [Clostridia bacterium]
MKTKLFKIMFTFAAVMLLTAVLAVTASAEIINGDCGAEGYSLPYVLDTETGVLRITGRGVMVDYAPWYSYRSDIKTITIEKGVKSIGSDAFAFFENLTSVTIPDSVTSIGDSTFSHCESLTDVTIPDSVTSIGDFAFSCCKSLTDVTIPDSVTSIGFRAFVACDNLIEIKVDE